MKNMKILFASVLTAIVLGELAWASPKTVILNVPSMTCPVCPITVRKALKKVQGVSKVDVRFEKKQVLVTFDDAKPQRMPAFPRNRRKPSNRETAGYTQ